MDKIEQAKHLSELPPRRLNIVLLMIAVSSVVSALVYIYYAKEKMSDDWRKAERAINKEHRIEVDSLNRESKIAAKECAERMEKELRERLYEFQKASEDRTRQYDKIAYQKEKESRKVEAENRQLVREITELSGNEKN